jgi:hypothetical protein
LEGWTASYRSLSHAAKPRRLWVSRPVSILIGLIAQSSFPANQRLLVRKCRTAHANGAKERY